MSTSKYKLALIQSLKRKGYVSASEFSAFKTSFQLDNSEAYVRDRIYDGFHSFSMTRVKLFLTNISAVNFALELIFHSFFAEEGVRKVLSITDGDIRKISIECYGRKLSVFRMTTPGRTSLIDVLNRRYSEIDTGVGIEVMNRDKIVKFGITRRGLHCFAEAILHLYFKNFYYLEIGHNQRIHDKPIAKVLKRVDLEGPWGHGPLCNSTVDLDIELV